MEYLTDEISQVYGGDCTCYCRDYTTWERTCQIAWLVVKAMKVISGILVKQPFVGVCAILVAEVLFRRWAC